jgi:hypothetical protein
MCYLLEREHFRNRTTNRKVVQILLQSLLNRSLNSTKLCLCFAV